MKSFDFMSEWLQLVFYCFSLIFDDLLTSLDIGKFMALLDLLDASEVQRIVVIADVVRADWDVF